MRNPIHRDNEGQAMVCTGCGETHTMAAIKMAHPSARSCCPERKMVPARQIWREWCELASARHSPPVGSILSTRGILRCSTCGKFHVPSSPCTDTRAPGSPQSETHGIQACRRYWPGRAQVGAEL